MRRDTPILKGFKTLFSNPFLILPPLLAQVVVSLFQHYGFANLWFVKFLASTYALTSIAFNGWKALKGERPSFLSLLFPPHFPSLFVSFLLLRLFYFLAVAGGTLFALFPGLLVGIGFLPYPFAFVSRKNPFSAFEGGFVRWFQLAGLVLVFYTLLYPLLFAAFRDFAYVLITPAFWLSVGAVWEEWEISQGEISPAGDEPHSDSETVKPEYETHQQA